MGSELLNLDERQLCSYLLDLAEAYFAKPDHQRAYDAWLAEKNKKPRQEVIPPGKRRKEEKE